MDRQACFFTDADRVFYLAALGHLADQYGCAIHAYVLMTNHIHLLITPSTADAPGKLLQALGRRYFRHVNDSYSRTGPLWEGRFKSCLVGEDSYLLACHRYVELNPVRAGMVADPVDYAWSSHRANAGLDPSCSTLLSVHDVMAALGPDVASRSIAYRAMFAADDPPVGVEAIRRMTRGNHALGSSRFTEEIAARLGRRATPGQRGRPARSHRKMHADPI